MIITRVPKRDLKSCRLAVKAWEGSIIPLLFDSVFVTARYADLEVAGLVASRFGDFVKTLIYSAEFFENQGFYSKYSKSAVKMRCQPCYERHINQHREIYANLALEQRVILKNGGMRDFLLRFFKTIPSISRIVLTHSWRRRQLDWCEQAAMDTKARSYKPFDKTFTCSNQNCNFLTCHLFSDDHFTHARPGRRASDQGASHWEDLMRALGESRVVVREIRIVAPLLDTMPLNIWRPSCGLGEIMIDTFSSLTKLHISLDLNYFEGYFQGTNELPLANGVLTKALSSATSLESLHITLVYANWGNEIRKYATDFGTLFKNSSFPKLKDMNLYRCSADEDELLSFLKRSPAVRSLTLKQFQLTGGYWVTLIQEIRDSTLVKDLQLLDIRGSMGDSVGEDIDNFEVGDCELESDVQELFNRQKGSRVSNAELKCMVEKRRMKIFEDVKRIEELLVGED